MYVRTLNTNITSSIHGDIHFLFYLLRKMYYFQIHLRVENASTRFYGAWLVGVFVVEKTTIM